MKYKFFAIFVLMMITTFAGIGFSGCGNAYDGIAVTVDRESVELSLDKNTDKGEGFVVVEVEGLKDGMVGGINILNQDNSTVKGEIFRQEGSKTIVKFTPQSAGVAHVSFSSQEYGVAVSRSVEIVVNRSPTSIEFDVSQKPCIEVGSSLNLQSSKLVTFYVDGSIQPVYPSLANFYLMSSSDTRWNSQYGTRPLTGVTVNNNIISATASAECGIAQLVARMPNGVETPVYIMVYKNITKENIFLYRNTKVITEINEMINPVAGYTNAFALKADCFVNQNYKIDIKSNDTDIIIVGSKNSNGEYNVSIADTGKTTITVAVSIIDPVTEMPYKVFNIDYPVNVYRIVTDVYLTGGTEVKSNTPINMDVQDYYREDMYGAKVNFSLSSNAADNYAVLRVTKVDGRNYTELARSDVIIYIDGKVYRWGSLVPSGTTFYVAVADKENCQINKEFVLSVVANTQLAGVPEVTNSIKFTIQAGVQDISFSSDYLTNAEIERGVDVGVDMSTSIYVNYVTSLGNNAGNPTFRNTVSEYVQIERTLNVNRYEYRIRGLQEAEDIRIVFSADSGVTKTLTINVRCLLESFKLSISVENNNLYDVNYRKQVFFDGTEGPSFDVNGIEDGGLETFMIQSNTSVRIGYSAGPTTITNASIKVYDPTVLEGDEEYVGLTGFTTGASVNTFTLTAKNATEVSDYVVVSVRFEFYMIINGVITKTNGVREFGVSVYQPTSLRWQENKDIIIAKQIYNKNHLNVDEQDKSELIMGADYNTGATYFERGGLITWYLAEEYQDKVTLSWSFDTMEITLNCALDDTFTEAEYSAVVDGYIVDFGAQRVIRLYLTIINPAIVSSIEFPGYIQDEGVRLNDLGVSSRTSKDLSFNVLPAGVYNDKLGYNIYQAIKSSGNIYIADAQITDANDLIVNVSLDNNKKKLSVSSQLGRTGAIIIRVFPLDAVTNTSIHDDEIIHIDILVIVEDGSFENPYSIYTEDDFVAIGDSADTMEKHYVLMRTLDLSSYTDALPLGKDANGVFSGSIQSYNYSNTGRRYGIMNIPASGSFVGLESDNTSSYTGLFAYLGAYQGELTTGMEVVTLANIDFCFDASYISFDNSNVSSNVYIGMLAGFVESKVKIHNVTVNIYNYSNTSLVIEDETTGDTVLYVGGIAGKIGNSTSSINIAQTQAYSLRGNAKLNITVPDNTRLFVGGMFGSAACVMGQDDDILNNVSIDITKSSAEVDDDVVGGLVGLLDTNSTLRSQKVYGTINAQNISNIGGLVGINKGVIGLYDSSHSTTYGVLASVSILGKESIGGLVGKNTNGAIITHAKVENYYSTASANYTHTLLQGVNNVGGLVGIDLGGSISYSYVAQYTGMTMVAQGTTLTSTTFYGDILGVSNVGGALGSATNTTLKSVFANTNIQQINVTNNAYYVGGFIGTLQNVDATAVYDIANILSKNEQSTIGGFAGNADYTNSTKVIKETYSYANITRNSATEYNLVASGSVNSNSVYYLSSATDTSNPKALIQDDIKLPTFQSFATGWVFSSDPLVNANWYAYSAGVNNDLAVLRDEDGTMLFSQTITDIQYTINYNKVATDYLPQYFGLSYGGVIVYDNIPQNSLLQRVLNLNDLLDISVEPASLLPRYWTILVSSSNTRIIEIDQPNQNLIDCKLNIKSTGIVTITLQSLLDANCKVSVELNVIRGFMDYDLLNSQNDQTIFDGTNLVHVRKDTGFSVLPKFILDAEYNFDSTYGYVYTIANTNIVGLDGIVLNAGSAKVLNNFPIILYGENRGQTSITITPFVRLNFGGVDVDFVFDQLTNPIASKTFNVKVYNGIQDVSVNIKGFEYYSGGYYRIALTIITDNLDVLNPIVLQLSRDEQTVSDVSRYCSELAPSQEYDSTTQLYTLNCNYLFSLSGVDRYLTSDTTLNASFTVSDEADSYTKQIDMLFKPSPVNKIDMSYYTYGVSSMQAGEASSTLIATSTVGVLKMDVSPAYANYDYVLLSSSIDAVTGQKVSLTQVAFKTRNGQLDILQGGSKSGNFGTLIDGSLYDDDGNLILQKITGYDNGVPYFDGTIYIATTIANSTVEGTEFVLGAIPYKVEGQAHNQVMRQQFLTLKTTFTPFAALSLDNYSLYGENIVARGKVANLTLSGVLQNSTVSYKTNYELLSSVSNYYESRCVFGTVAQTYFGERQSVNFKIPLYIGINASPRNGVIQVTVTIESTNQNGIPLSPIVLVCDLYVVDFIIDSISIKDINGTIDSGETLQVGINSWKNMLIELNVDLPNINEFKEYNPAVRDETAFINYYNGIKTRVYGNHSGGNDIDGLQDSLNNPLVNMVWQYKQNNVLSKLNLNTYYNYFLLGTLGDNLVMRGRQTISNLEFRAAFNIYYDINNSAQQDISNYYALKVDSDRLEKGALINYITSVECNFYIDIYKDVTEDAPIEIEDATQFRQMKAGLDYILTNDIVLNSWSPISTEISSLDGNGYIIFINSFASSTGGSTNYGLWSTVSANTTLLNLVVDVSHVIDVYLQDATSVNFGFIAGQNNGYLYNCEVCVTEDIATWKASRAAILNSRSATDATERDSDWDFADNIYDTITRNANNKTYASTFIYTSKLVSGQATTTNIGGLVGLNTGTITNCKVGSIEQMSWRSKYEGVTDYKRNQGINIFASGNVGGLVGVNQGVISNSYYANGYIVNTKMDIYSETNTNGARTGGLVAVQEKTGRIYASYVQGQVESGKLRSELGGIYAYSGVGGFVYSNAGEILNCYSNINLSSASGMGGFVYDNLADSIIKTSYSMSNVRTQGLINGVFIGINSEGNLKDGRNTVIENCYYLSEEGLIVDANERAVGLSSEDWQIAANFEKFVITTSTDENGVISKSATWTFDTEKGPQLNLANRQLMSLRTLPDIGVGDDQKIIFAYVNDYEKGSRNNPLLIKNLSDWTTKVFSKTKDASTSPYFTNSVFGNYYVMLIDDITFENSSEQNSFSKDISDMTFSGILYGNGHIISGLNYSQPSEDINSTENFGLFNEINNGIVTDLTLILQTTWSSRSQKVGMLAGTISGDWTDKDVESRVDGAYTLDRIASDSQGSLISNVIITSPTRLNTVRGYNLVGALAGLVKGNTRLFNITSSLSTFANITTAQNSEFGYYGISDITKLSYAGGIAGVVDLMRDETSRIANSKVTENYLANPRIQNVKVSSNVYFSMAKEGLKRFVNNLEIYADIAGGAFGLISESSEAFGVVFDIYSDYSPRVKGKDFAGGLIGENRGSLLNSYISSPTQKDVDSTIMSTSNPVNFVNYKDLFNHDEEVNAIGGLVGLNAGGYISNAYSRISVISEKAKIAGGLIGLSVPNYIVDIDDTAQTISNKNIIQAFIKNLTRTTVQQNWFENSDNTPRENFDLNNSVSITPAAYLKSVYTTGAVEASSTDKYKGSIGGLIGVNLWGPIYTENSSVSIAAVNNFDTSKATFTPKLTNNSIYIGSVVGYLKYDLANGPFVTDSSMGSISAIKVFSKIGNTTINPFGNTNRVLNIVALESTDSNGTELSAFISSAVKPRGGYDPETNEPFNNFDESYWACDNNRISFRFPYLSLKHKAIMASIKNVDEFFAYLSNTQSNSQYRIIQHLTITGNDWMNFVNNNTFIDEKGESRQYYTGSNRNSLGTLTSPVRGLLEGAVQKEGATLETTPANITFRDFNDEQMRAFKTLFGYTQSLKMSKINFIFDQDFTASFNVIGVSQENHEENYYGALAREMRSTDLDTISVRFGTNNATTLSSDGQSHFALVTAKAYGCCFDAVELSGNISVTNNNRNFTFGSYFAIGKDNEIKYAGAQIDGVNIAYSSNLDSNCELNIGGLVGKTEGLNVSISSSVSPTMDLQSSAKIMYVGGILGQQDVDIVNISRMNSSATIKVDNDHTNMDASGVVATLYVGGAIGKVRNSTTTNAKSSAIINVTQQSGILYLGGVIGLLEATHYFNGENNGIYSGSTISNLYSNAKLSMANCKLNTAYVGGVIGKTSDDLVLQVEDLDISYSITEKDAYINVHSAAEITQSNDTQISSNYVGGIFGYVELNKSGVATDIYGVVERTRIFNIISLNGMIFTGYINVSNATMNLSAVDYIGGLVGYSKLKLLNALSNGVIVSNSLNSTSKIGGLIGQTTNGVNYCVTLTTINTQKANQNSEEYLDVALGETNSIRAVDNVMTASILTGSYYNKYAQDLSLEEIYKTAIDTKIFANWSNTLVGDVYVWYPTAVRDNNLNLHSGSVLVPVYVDAMGNIAQTSLLYNLYDTENNQSTIILNVDYVLDSNNIMLNNIRKLIGNGHKITASNQDLLDVTQDYGVFDNIPDYSLISNVKFDIGCKSLAVNVTQETNIGLLSGVNNGILFDVFIGRIAQLTEASDVANFGNGAKQKYNNKVFASKEVSTLKVTSVSDQALNIGGVVGVNFGVMYGVATNLDVIVNNKNNVLNVGNLNGINYGFISNVNINGRVAVNVLEDSSTINMGGISGVENASSVRAVISNTNIYVQDTFAHTTIKKALGFAETNDMLINSNVIVNKEIIADKFSTFVDNTSMDIVRLTDAEMSRDIDEENDTVISVMSYLTEDNGFRTDIWARENNNFYGYPRLKVIDQETSAIVSNEDGTLNYAYFMVSEAIQFNRDLLSIFNNLSAVQDYELYICCYMVRDMVMSEDVLKVLSQKDMKYKQINGYSHTIVIPEIKLDNDFALFKSISSNTTVEYLGISVIGNKLYNSSYVSMAPLAITNNGNINNVYAISIGNIESKSSTSSNMFGGLVCTNYGSITDCWTDVNYVIKNGTLGGIVAKQEANAFVTKCFSSGNIILIDRDYTEYCGGIIGVNASNKAVKDCYVFGTCVISNCPSGNSEQKTAAQSHYSVIVGNNTASAEIKNVYGLIYTERKSVSENTGLIFDNIYVEDTTNNRILLNYYGDTNFEGNKGPTHISDNFNVVNNTNWAKPSGQFPYLKGVTPQDRYCDIYSNELDTTIFDIGNLEYYHNNVWYSGTRDTNSGWNI